MAEEYRIGSGFSEQELNTATFWVKNQSKLRLVGRGALVILILCTWGYSIWSLLDAYAISYPRESRIPLLISRDQFSPEGLKAVTPQALGASDVSIFPNTDNREDLFAELHNPNGQWWADFTYQFQTGATTTPSHRGYILPNSTRSFTELGWSGGVSSPSFLIKDLRWHHLDPAIVGADYDSYALARQPFTFDAITYKNDLVVGTQTVGQTDFVLSNSSGFGFWNVDLTITLYRGTAPVAITTVTQRELKPGERRPVSINWFENETGITDTKIEANVNVLDPATFLPTDRF